ncbi:MAG: hypothetical protein ACTHKA_25335 [Anaerocolumna jejuensis]
MGDVIIQRVLDDFYNESDYDDFAFAGGLFAVINLYLDEDLGERLRSLIKSFMRLITLMRESCATPLCWKNLFHRMKDGSLSLCLYR